MILLATTAMVFLSPAAAQTPAPARIFGLNLFALPMDVQWGPWKAEGLFARGVSKAALLEPLTPGTVQFRRAGQAAWSTAKGADGQPLSAPLEPGGIYVLVVRSNGNGELVKVDAAVTSAPLVLFVNAAKGPAAQFRLGSSASADGQEPGWGSFTEAVAGVQTLTWSWPVMPPGTDFYKASSAQPGQPGTVRLTEGHWYVAVIQSVNGQITDITP